MQKENVTDGLNRFYDEIKESGGKFWVSGSAKALHMTVLKNAVELINKQDTVDYACDTLRRNGWKEDEISILDALKHAECLTVDQMMELPIGTEVWVEESNYAGDCQWLFPIVLETRGTKGISHHFGIFDFETYNRSRLGWRLWTKRPTDKQRKEAEWKTV